MSVAGLRRAPVAAGGARKAQVLQAYLRSLLGPRDSGQLVEIRFRRGARMSQCFFGRTEVLQAAQVILALGERTDVYVGAAPRTRAAGGKDAVRELWAVWADCDDEEARERLWDFRPAPSIVVATGFIRSERSRSASRRAVWRWRHVTDDGGRDAGGDRDGDR